MSNQRVMVCKMERFR